MNTHSLIAVSLPAAFFFLVLHSKNTQKERKTWSGRKVFAFFSVQGWRGKIRMDRRMCMCKLFVCVCICTVYSLTTNLFSKTSRLYETNKYLLKREWEQIREKQKYWLFRNKNVKKRIVEKRYIWNEILV